MAHVSTRASGIVGEESAIDYLQGKGYKIIGKNFRSRFGEIDIIALEDGALVFVEVKTRWSNKYGTPEEAVTPQKIRSIIKTADYYKLLHPNTPNLMRIDVVAIDAIDADVTGIRLIKNVTG